MNIDTLINEKVKILERIRTRNIVVKTVREYVYRTNQKDIKEIRRIDEQINTLP